MPSIATQTVTRWKALWNVLTGGTKGTDLAGSSSGSSFGQQLYKDYRLDIPERPVRPVMGSIQYSRDLLEIIEWSPEARTALSFLSRDPFMEREGRIGSWQVGMTVEGGGNVNPKILSVASDLKNRRYGKQLVLGGLRLQEAARLALGLGDSFLQLAIEKEGITPGRFCISRSLYMPSMSMFVQEDEYGDESGYVQKLDDEDDVFFNPLKILHFSYERRRLYGESVLFQSIPAWRKLKRTAPATEKAVTQAGVAPWVHTMGPNATERDRENYKNNHQAERAEGFLSDIYLPNGASVKKAEGNVNGITETVNYENNLIKRMIPLGLPPYFFSTISNDQQNAREISGQPAMLYARTIASIRSMLGEQIKWALDIELCLTFGFDFVMQNPYDIVWPKWEVLPPNQMPKDPFQKPAESQSNNVPTETPATPQDPAKADRGQDEKRLRVL